MKLKIKYQKKKKIINNLLNYLVIFNKKINKKIKYIK